LYFHACDQPKVLKRSKCSDKQRTTMAASCGVWTGMVMTDVLCAKLHEFTAILAWLFVF